MTQATKHTPECATYCALTPAMRRELRSISTGYPTDAAEWHAAGALWFAARDRVIGALLRRGLIADQCGDYAITDAGRAALAKVQA
jgi:hypothetical protein